MEKKEKKVNVMVKRLQAIVTCIFRHQQGFFGSLLI